MANKLRNFMQIRADALALGDLRLARAMDVEIARIGYRVPQGVHIYQEGAHETTQAIALEEQAIPEKVKRGRPPKPRCEHGNLLERCEDCRLEGTVE